jgi:hypothetical protein
MDWKKLRKNLPAGWYEDETDPQWIFPDGYKISSGWSQEHGELLGPVDYDNYWSTVHNFLKTGMIRRAMSGMYQAWDRSSFSALEKLMDTERHPFVILELIGEGKSYSFTKEEYEEAGFNLAKTLRQIEPRRI